MLPVGKLRRSFWGVGDGPSRDVGICLILRIAGGWDVVREVYALTSLHFKDVQTFSDYTMGEMIAII